MPTLTRALALAGCFVLSACSIPSKEQACGRCVGPSYNQCALDYDWCVTWLTPVNQGACIADLPDSCRAE